MSVPACISIKFVYHRAQEPVNAGPKLYLVLDTNVLIDNLNTIRCFSEDLDHATLPWPMKIIVPSVVLSELDG